MLTTIVLFLPMVGLTVLLFLNGKTQVEQIKWTTFGFTILTFIASLVMWGAFDNSVSGLQMVHQWEWLNIQIGEQQVHSVYYVGVDGLSMLLVLLTTFIMPIAVLASFSMHVLEERGRQKLYYGFLLLLEWAMLGVFFIQDLIIFYVFWEVTLVPMYFLIGIWGAERRVYAAVKFFLYTMAGSILMLIAILYVANVTGTFLLPEILQQVQANPHLWDEWGGAASASSVTGAMLFFGFFIAFAIKVPIFPFHSWLPDAHVQAPTTGSVILAGVLLKMGTYGLVRFNLQMFPEQSVQFAPLIAGLGVIGIIYGAWVSYAQTDVKKLVAYTSISHLGFVVLGIFALNSQGIQGATLQMVNHGISTGGLFLVVGIMYERYHTKAMDAYGGIWRIAPTFGAVALVISLSSMGLPGLNGFIGEFTILLGSLGSTYLGFFFTLFSTLGVIMAAIYILYMFQHVFMGDLKVPHGEDAGTFSLNLKWNEIAVLVPILVMIFWIGLQPGGFFDVMNASTNELVAHVESANVEVLDANPIDTNAEFAYVGEAATSESAE
ncbi:NADH-quinone oxidoreductase subunit M [Phototrophicus methaneseepsis]|uniref:NADH-quinone oxidoreductase subunit M n=1 Tax=Phototrophicus methaneseepsis TaxID=2710758 RepID=A0A7S8EE44_9CHLR|nr:NADH-quinone oxidoreductase subunit M [Phototrophicus methaneseepsis]